MSNTLINANRDYHEDFLFGLDQNIWSLKLIENPNCIEVGTWFDKPAIKVTVHKNDYQGVGNDGRITERAELTEQDYIQIEVNTPIWYAFSFYIPEDFLVINNRLVFAQWKQSTKVPESPFISWRYINNKLVFQIVHEYDRIDFDYDHNESIRGKWHTIVVNYQLNKDAAGYVKAWLDGHLFAEYSGKLGSVDPVSDKIQFKFGIYRDQLDTPQSIYFSDIKRSLVELKNNI